MDGSVEDQFPEGSENLSSFVFVVIGNGFSVGFTVWLVFKNKEESVSDNNFTEVSPIEGEDKVSIFNIGVEGAVFVSSFNVSIDSDWVIDEDLEIFNGVWEVKNVKNK